MQFFSMNVNGPHFSDYSVLFKYYRKGDAHTVLAAAGLVDWG